MVVSSINNYQVSNKALSFGAQTRSEREAAMERAQERSYVTPLTADEVRRIQQERDRIQDKRSKIDKQREAERAKRAEEKQYQEDVRDLKDTNRMINELTNKGPLANGAFKRAGKIADVVITGTLSGMALHWSTGKAFMMIHKVIKKPKVSNALGNIRRPFQIIGSSIAEGAQTAWNSMARKVRATEKGKKFVESAPIKKLSEGMDKIGKSYSNFKQDAKNLKAEDIKSGVSTVFGVSGFTAGVVEKLDPPENKQTNKKVRNADNAD